MLGGIAVRRRRSRVAGDMMIAVGPLPIVAFFWLILPPLAGIIVIVAAAFDRPRRAAWASGAGRLWPVSACCWPASSLQRPRSSPC